MKKQGGEALTKRKCCVLCPPGKLAKYICPKTFHPYCGMCARDMCPELVQKRLRGDVLDNEDIEGGSVERDVPLP